MGCDQNLTLTLSWTQRRREHQKHEARENHRCGWVTVLVSNAVLISQRLCASSTGRGNLKRPRSPSARFHLLNCSTSLRNSSRTETHEI